VELVDSSWVGRGWELFSRVNAEQETGAGAIFRTQMVLEMVGLASLILLHGMAHLKVLDMGNEPLTLTLP
jgi:hypothetical protein